MEKQNDARADGLLRGANGKVQGRKLAAWICFVVGLALLVQESLEPATVDAQSRIAPAVVALVFSLLFWGLVTVQNIVQLVALLKGQGPGQSSMQDFVDRSAEARSKEADNGK